MDIPKLEKRCNSWILTNLITKRSFEIFDSRRARDKLRKLDGRMYSLETTYSYLCRINKEIMFSSLVSVPKNQKDEEPS